MGSTSDATDTSSTDVPAFCGDGNLDPGEECDDGAAAGAPRLEDRTAA